MVGTPEEQSRISTVDKEVFVAVRRVDVPTALHFFCSADRGVQQVRTKFIFTRKLGSVHDGQPTVILRVSAMKRLMLGFVHDRQPAMFL